jgi:hypothetical protein
LEFGLSPTQDFALRWYITPFQGNEKELLSGPDRSPYSEATFWFAPDNIYLTYFDTKIPL